MTGIFSLHNVEVRFVIYSSAVLAALLKIIIIIIIIIIKKQDHKQKFLILPYLKK